MASIIPSISSGVAGTLGVLHLPRLWQKASLAAVDKLHEDYAPAGPGFDQMVLDGLGIDRGAFLDFVAERRPTYPELEAWILGQKGGAIAQGVIGQINAAIAAHEHESSVRAEILDDCGIEDGGVIRDALTLNNLDDWQSFYREEIA